MRFIGMPLTTAPHKSLPNWLWKCPRDVAAAFVSGMWDGDGSIHANRNQASYASPSKQLVQDLQLLLTNFGIISRVYSKLTPPTERVDIESLGWRLEVLGENVSKLRDVLRLRIKRKSRLSSQKPDVVSKRDGVYVLPLLEKLKTHFKGKNILLWTAPLRRLDMAVTLHMTSCARFLMKPSLHVIRMNIFVCQEL